MQAHEDDIFLWADGTWCYRSELGEMRHMSDDTQVIPAYSKEWDDFIERNGG